MTFNNGKEMLDYIQSGKDLYSPSEQLYIFLYNGYGSIAYYYISNEEAEELRQTDEYWGASLGPGGKVVDTKDYYKDYYSDNLDMYNECLNNPDIEWPEDFCDRYYMLNDWEDVTQ